MKSDTNPSIVQTINNINNYTTILPCFLKVIMFGILLILTINELFNFILLRGFENPLGYCLFKLIVYSFGMLFTKFSDISSMSYLLNNIKDLTEEMVNKLEEIKIAGTRAKEENNERRIDS